MRISRRAEYALRALVAMARRQQSVQIQELSSRENIPVKFLEQILLALRHAGFLTSKRGVGGGYTLRLAPPQITVGEVIRVMDGPIAPLPCTLQSPTEPCSCPDTRNCPLRMMMLEVRDSLETFFGSRTIEDLVRMSADKDMLAFEI